VELTTDRIKNLVAIAGSWKKCRRCVSGQSTCNQLFLASALIHIYTTAGLKVGFIKPPLKQAGQGQRGLKGCACSQATVHFHWAWRCTTC